MLLSLLAKIKCRGGRVKGGRKREGEEKERGGKKEWERGKGEVER